MAMVMMGARCPVEWKQRLVAIAKATHRTEAEILREAIGNYLGTTDPRAVKEVLEQHEIRLGNLEARLRHLSGL